MRPLLRSFAALLLLHCTIATTFAGTAEEDWQAVVALDAGPAEQPKDTQGMAALVLNHLARQEAALRRFLAGHATDSHAFEARLRLARVLQRRGEFEQSDKLTAEASRMLDELEKTATPEQRPEVAFSKLTRFMRTINRTDPSQREELLQAARRFQHDYPDDRRIAALLAEVATLFDAKPVTKESLLEDALSATKDEDLKSRIADDLKRTRLFGQEVPLSFTSIQGQDIKPGSFLGHPSFVIFFAGFSPPAMVAVAKLQEAVAQLPAGSVRVVGVSLDAKRETVAAILKARNLSWPVAFDGKGWVSPMVRDLGINTLPTVWLLDAHGRLRSLNALEGATEMARQLLQER
jgi:peroxiredoxin